MARGLVPTWPIPRGARVEATKVAISGPMLAIAVATASLQRVLLLLSLLAILHPLAMPSAVTRSGSGIRPPIETSEYDRNLAPRPGSHPRTCQSRIQQWRLATTAASGENMSARPDISGFLLSLILQSQSERENHPQAFAFRPPQHCGRISVEAAGATRVSHRLNERDGASHDRHRRVG